MEKKWYWLRGSGCKLAYLHSTTYIYLSLFPSHLLSSVSINHYHLFDSVHVCLEQIHVSKIKMCASFPLQPYIISTMVQKTQLKSWYLDIRW